MKMIGVWLDEQLLNRIKKRAKSKSISVSAYIRLLALADLEKDN